MITHKGSKVIESNRLILRPFTMEDAEAMYPELGLRPGGYKVFDLACPQ